MDDAGADGLANATIGEALITARGDGEAAGDGAGAIAPGDGLAAAGDALLLVTDGDALTDAEAGLAAAVGAAASVGGLGAAAVHAAAKKTALNPIAKCVLRTICRRANANYGPPGADLPMPHAFGTSDWSASHGLIVDGLEVLQRVAEHLPPGYYPSDHDEE